MAPSWECSACTMVNDNKHGLACIMCGTPRPWPHSRTTAVASAATNDGTVRGDDRRGARGAASSQPPSLYASSSALSAMTTTLTPDPAPTLTTALKKRSALASVANPYNRKKKSKPLSGKENLGLVSQNTNDIQSSCKDGNEAKGGQSLPRRQAV
jgi:hypothetical protein